MQDIVAAIPPLGQSATLAAPFCIIGAGVVLMLGQYRLALRLVLVAVFLATVGSIASEHQG